MLHINALTYRIAGRTLFENTTLRIAAGQRVGLVGRNGAGKSTLFRLILEELQADAGSVAVRPRARIGRLAQEMPDGDDNLIDTVLTYDHERAALIAESDSSHDGHRLADIHERLSAIDAHTAPARAGAILAGLGFDADAQARPVNSFSGGWRMRVALAGALFAKPDLLLLDEPTNHLDLEASLWLEGHLATYDGTLLVISHDRDILNAVVDRIVHIDQCKLVGYGGNYDRFEQVRRERAELLAKTAVKQADERKKIQSFIDRFKAKASKAAQAQSRVKMLERMGPPISVIEERPVSFDFPSPEALPPPLLAIEGGQAGYAPGKPVLRNLDLRIDLDDRIALLGANGNGKSTLAKVLSGRLPLLEGRLQRPPKLRIGYFAQDQTDELNVNQTPFSHMQELMPGAQPSKVRAQLGRFGFTQDRADLKVGSLSGGEKARLLFALMTRDAPHLLILDEPTNHLDIDSREALVGALNAYEGAVIIISHDARLIELAADRLWLVADGKVVDYDGDMADYRALLLGRAPKAQARAQGTAADRKEERRDKAEKRGRLAPLRKAAQEAEKTVTRLSAEKAKLEAELANPVLYAEGQTERTNTLRKKLADLVRTLETAEEAWLNAQQELDQTIAAE